MLLLALHQVKRKVDGKIYVIKQIDISVMSKDEQKDAIKEVGWLGCSAVHCTTCTLFRSRCVACFPLEPLPQQ